MTPFFSSTLHAESYGIIRFTILRTSKIDLLRGTLEDHNRSQIGPPVEPELRRFEPQTNYELNAMVDSVIFTIFCDI